MWSASRHAAYARLDAPKKNPPIVWLKHMDNQESSDLRVIRQTVVHLHTLAIEKDRKLTTIERLLRDILIAVGFLVVAVVTIGYQMTRP